LRRLFCTAPPSSAPVSAAGYLTDMRVMVKSPIVERTNMRMLVKLPFGESTNARTLVKSQTAESTDVRILVKNTIFNCASLVLDRLRLGKAQANLALRSACTIFAGMEQTKYTQIPPAGMFKVTVTRTVKHDTRTKMHYEFCQRKKKMLIL
jgi:hypothetical protein